MHSELPAYPWGAPITALEVAHFLMDTLKAEHQRTEQLLARCVHMHMHGCLPLRMHCRAPPPPPPAHLPCHPCCVCPRSLRDAHLPPMLDHAACKHFIARGPSVKRGISLDGAVEAVRTAALAQAGRAASSGGTW